MIITNIHLKNFRSHADTKLELAPLTVVRGTNAAGKTSVEQGIEIALASHADGTSRDGKGASHFIRMGETRADIDMTIEAMGKRRRLECVLRNGSRTLLVTDPADEQYSGGKEYENWLSQNKDVISALVNNRYFVDLKEDEQKELLASIVMPKTYEWPAWVRPSLNKVKISVDLSRPPFDIITEIYDKAYAQRTGVNRAIKEWRAPAEAGDPPTATLEQAKEKLQERQGQLDELMKDRATLTSSSEAYEAKKNAAFQRLAKSDERLQREKRNLEAISDRMLTPSKLKATEKEAEKLKIAQELEARIAELGAEKTVKKRSLDAMKKMEPGSKCPTCAHVLTEEDFKTIVQPLLEAYNTVSEQETAAIAERKKLGNPAEAAQALIEHKSAENERKRAYALVKEEEEAVADAQKALDELGAAPESADTSEIDGKIEDLKKKVSAINAAIAEITIYNRKKEEIEAALARKEELDAERAELEKLVKYFGDEARSTILAESTGDFIAGINEVLSAWGYACSISFDPFMFSISYRKDGKVFDVPLRFLSKSQRYRFATAFQVALSIFSGFRFVVVDEADIFDSKGRNALMRALMTAELDQVIVLSTDERENVPAAANAVFYRFDDIAADGEIPTTQVRQLIPANREE